MGFTTGPWPDRFRRTGIVFAALSGLYLFARVAHQHYPLDEWLFWRYAAYWLACTALCLAALGAGHVTLKRVLGHTLPAFEHLTIAFVLGMFELELLVFFGGLLKLYGTVFFFAMPLGVLALTGWPLWKYLRRLTRHLRAHRHKHPLPAWALPALGVGFCAVVMVYFLVLTPHNVQFDSRWKHMAIAEDYVAWGGLRRFGDGWVFAARPHFTSLLYTWAFMAPGARLFDHMELAAHIEFVIVMFTSFVGIAAVVRRLVPAADPRLVWVARFLFPGVLLYDGTLSGGADHITAMFGPPAFLLLLRAWRELRPAYVGLLCTMLGATVAHKYTVALMLVPFPVVAITLRIVWLGIRALRGRASTAVKRNWWLAPLVATAASLLFSAPHWGKNWAFYGDPFYPLLHRHFDPSPWAEDAAYMLKWGFTDFQMWRPERNWSGFLETLEVLATWSFVPNNWRQFHGTRPIIGSLFTLLLLALPFSRKTKRIWVLVAWVHVGIFAWYWTHHQDRYLQGVMPLLGAGTAAMVILVWRSGRYIVRGALLALLGYQVVWGADVYFIVNHTMFRGSPLNVVASLLRAGHEKKYEHRFGVQERYQRVRERLPEGAVVVMHENKDNLGIGRSRLGDMATWQYGISYAWKDSPRDVWDTLREAGATHVWWQRHKAYGFEALASTIMFQDFAHRRLTDVELKHNEYIGRIPSQPPPDAEAFDDSVVMLVCRHRVGFRSGKYRVSDLRVPSFGPESRVYPAPRVVATNSAHLEELLRDAAFAVTEPRCHRSLPSGVTGAFELVAKRSRVHGSKHDGHPYWIWLRKQPK